MKELKELKELLCDELKSYGKKGDLTAGSLGTIDTLAHAVKNLDKIIEAYDGGYSGHYYDDRSYTRGRDGRYVRDGYSRGSLTDKLRDLMNEAPDDRTRMEIKRLMEKMD